MPHIVFASHGSLGDLYPFLALGTELMRRGHRVTIATHAGYRETVESNRLGFAPMRPDRPNDPAFHARFMNRRHGAEFVFKHYLAPAIADSVADLSAAVQNADLLVSVSLALAAPLVAEITGIPWVSCAFQPSMLYSATDPPHLPPLPFIRRPWATEWNRRLYCYAERGIADWVAPIAELRTSLGLPPMRAHPAFRGQHSPERVLALFSPLLGAPQADWPAHTLQTGAILPADSTPMPPDLAAFLDAGPAPLVFTLGSASAQAAGDFFRTSAEVATRVGGRAVFLLGSNANRTHLPDALPPHWFACGYAPYAAIFARARALIHQGGMGTSCFGLAAGKPQLLVPFAHDQHDNALRVARLGEASVLPAHRYTTGRASTQLHRLIDRQNPTRLQALASAITGENGCRNAADRLLEMLPKRADSVAGQAPPLRL